MNIRPIFLTAYLLTLCWTASEASAQAREGERFGQWTVGCEPDAAGKSAKCFVFQRMVTDDGRQAIHTRIGLTASGKEAQIVSDLPLGLNLLAGAALKIEPSGKQIPMQFHTCLPEGCRATAILNATNLKELRDATSAAIGAIPYGQSQTLTLPLSLDGINAALGVLK